VKKTYLILFLFTSLIGCKNEQSLTAETQFFTEAENDLCKDETCPSITIEYPKYKEVDTVAEQLNHSIEDFIISSIYLGEGTPNLKTTLDDAVSTFILASRDHKTEFDIDLDYEADISIFEIYRNEQLICLEENFYQYTGGAHGMSGTFFLIADAETGKTIAPQDLFADYESFSKVAENEFKKQQGIAINTPLEDTEYWFENGVFYLPYSPGISENGFLFIYQPYDIAPFSEGFVELSISWELAQPYLSKKYFE